MKELILVVIVVFLGAASVFGPIFVLMEQNKRENLLRDYRQCLIWNEELKCKIIFDRTE